MKTTPMPQKYLNKYIEQRKKKKKNSKRKKTPNCMYIVEFSLPIYINLIIIIYLIKITKYNTTTRAEIPYYRFLNIRISQRTVIELIKYLKGYRNDKDVTDQSVSRG